MDKEELGIVLEVVAEDLLNKIDNIIEDIPIFLKPIVTQFMAKLDNLKICDIIKLYNTEEVLAKINRRLEEMM